MLFCNVGCHISSKNNLLSSPLKLAGLYTCCDLEIAREVVSHGLTSLGSGELQPEPLLLRMLLLGKQPPYYQEAQAALLRGPGRGELSPLPRPVAEFSAEVLSLTWQPHAWGYFGPSSHPSAQQTAHEAGRLPDGHMEIKIIALSHQCLGGGLLQGDFSLLINVFHFGAQLHA